MSKFLGLGMPLQEVVYRSTHKPAEVIRHPQLGHLSIGAEADLAAFALHEGDFAFVDSGRARMKGRQKLECELTLRAGPSRLGLKRSQPNGLGRGWRIPPPYLRPCKRLDAALLLMYNQLVSPILILRLPCVPRFRCGGEG